MSKPIYAAREPMVQRVLSGIGSRYVQHVFSGMCVGSQSANTRSTRMDVSVIFGSRDGKLSCKRTQAADPRVIEMSEPVQARAGR